MIQIYIPGNETFTRNGDAVLMCTVCDLTAELNGTWSLRLDHPIDRGGRWKLITENAVLKVPTWQDDDQLYRISRVTKTEDGVTATAYPIFYDSAKDCFLLDCRPTGKTGQQALDIMTEGSPYSCSSNITAGNTAYFVRRNLLSAIMGNESPTFLGRWGGEVLFDNYTVIINDRVGGDYGAEARYGLNIEGSQYTVDTSELITRIVPVSFNGHLMSGNYVDSSHINDYPTVYTKEIRYEHIKLASDLNGDAQDVDIICDDQTELDAALLAAAQAEFATGCDIPKVSMDIDIAAISGQRLKMTEPLTDTTDGEILDTLDDEIFTVFYESYKTLENIKLGDTVRCRHYKLDITSVARVVSMTWDCIRERVSQLTIGDYQESYAKQMSGLVDRVNSAIRGDGSVVADQIQGFVDGSKAQLRAQYNIAERQDVLAILFENLDSTSDMYGATGIGTQGISISKERTADGQAWDWTTAITANGINAGVGVFGILSDSTGNNYIDLDTGEVHFGDLTNYISYDPETGSLDLRVSSFSLAGSTIADIAGSAVDAFDATLDQTEVFNRLTNNQANQGIYLDNGNLYINASAIRTGTLTAIEINNGNGTFSVTSAGKLTATDIDVKGTIRAGTYLGLPSTGMSVTSSGGLQGTATAGYTGSVLNGSTVGALPVTSTGLSYTSGSNTMSFTTGGLSMGGGVSLGVDGTGKISNILVGANAIYSAGHTAYNSPTAGFYLDKDGVFGVGNSTNYMRFYNGSLDIKCSSFSLSGSSIADIASGYANTAESNAKSYADGKASTAQSNAESYAYTQATNAYNNAKSYTDGQISSLPTPEAMTQQNVFNALTNNGQTQGIYLHTDSDGVSRVYINASYIASGTIAANLISATSLSAISANLGTVTAGSINISGTGTGAGTMTLSNGVLSATNAVIDGTITGHNAGFDGTFTVGNIGQTNDAVFNCGIDCGNISAGNVSGTTFSCSTLNATNISGTHFTSPWTIQGMSTVSTNTAMFNISGSVGTIAYGSASSIRYKDVIRDMTSEDVEKAYGIQPVIAKYKDGYLVETDERVGMAYPMFVAEDVEKYLPTVATHRDGLTENWDERAMIPVMFQMIKSLKAELEALKNGKV